MISGATGVTEEKLMEALCKPDATMQSIAEEFDLRPSLLHYATINQYQSVIAILEKGVERFDFNEPNTVGRTIVHTIAALGQEQPLQQLQIWVRQGRVNPQAITDTHCNFLHYITHVTDPSLLATYFSLATQAQVTTINQADSSPLQLAIAQDNVNFLKQAVASFPALLAVEKSGMGCRLTHQHHLLHHIAKEGAVQCFGFLRSQFADDSIWCELMHSRNETEECPSDTAVLAGQSVLFQMFSGYRDPFGTPTLSWLAAQAATLTEESAKCLPEPLLPLYHEAQNEKAFQAQQLAKWNALALDDDDCILTLGVK